MTTRGRTRSKREEGFTLIEVLGAALIMAFGLLALVNAMNFAYRMQTNATTRSVEWAVVNAKMSELQGLPFDYWGDASATFPATFAFGTDVTIGGATYRNHTIQELLATNNPEEDWAYSEWKGSVTVRALDPSGAAGGDGKILRRLDVNIRNGAVGAADIEDTMVLVIVDIEDRVS